MVRKAVTILAHSSLSNSISVSVLSRMSSKIDVVGNVKGGRRSRATHLVGKARTASAPCDRWPDLNGSAQGQQVAVAVSLSGMER